jgi:hypothetical protein
VAYERTAFYPKVSYLNFQFKELKQFLKGLALTRTEVLVVSRLGTQDKLLDQLESMTILGHHVADV